MSESVIEGATITVTQGVVVIDTMATDVLGQASTTLNAREYTVTIEADNYETADFPLTVSEDNHVVVFQFNTRPKTAHGQTVNLALILTPAATQTAKVNEAMALAVDVDCEALITEALSENAPTVEAVPTGWFLFTMMIFESISLNTGTISPSEGRNSIADSDQTVAATTKQHSLYYYMVADGLQVNANAATNEIVDTAHSFLFEKPSPLGSEHALIAFFRSAYQISASGTTTDGAYQILAATTKAFTQNIGANYIDHYDEPGHVPHWTRYQWYLDGAPVGTNSASYTPPAQAVGTSHTVSVAFTLT